MRTRSSSYSGRCLEIRVLALSNVDFLLINVATMSGKEVGPTKKRMLPVTCNEQTSTWADFQLAALSAPLASFLSTARVRPPYLSPGLYLFRTGKQETGTKLAEFCARALLSLDVLIHPRALPLVDSSSHNPSNEGFNQKFTDNLFFGSQQTRTPFSRGILGMGEPDPDDDLYKSWLGNGEETEVPPTKNTTDQEMRDANEPPVKNLHEGNKENSAEKSVDEVISDEDYNNEIVMEPERNQGSMSDTSEKGFLVKQVDRVTLKWRIQLTESANLVVVH